MGTKTINALTETTTPAAGDFLALWRAANGDTRKVSRANLVGATLTGAGTIATGGFTLTVPATGTAALLGTAQTFSALKTFSAGLTFGQDTLSYYDEGTWTPVIADASTAGNTAGGVTSTRGDYARFGNVMHLWCSVQNIDTTGLTSGNVLYIRGLPAACKTASGYIAVGSVRASRMTYTGWMVASIGSGDSVMTLTEHTSANLENQMTVADIASSTFTDFYIGIAYQVS